MCEARVFKRINSFLHSGQVSLSLGSLRISAFHAKSMHAWQDSSLILYRYKLARSIAFVLIYINININLIILDLA